MRRSGAHNRGIQRLASRLWRRLILGLSVQMTPSGAGIWQPRSRGRGLCGTYGPMLPLFRRWSGFVGSGNLRGSGGWNEVLLYTGVAVILKVRDESHLGTGVWTCLDWSLSLRADAIIAVARRASYVIYLLHRPYWASWPSASCIVSVN